MSNMKHQFCYNCSNAYSFHDTGTARTKCSSCGASMEFIQDIDPTDESTIINKNDCVVKNGGLVEYYGRNGILMPPEGSLIILKCAFYKSNIRTLHCPDTLKGISIDAFYKSSYLSTVIFGNSLIIIGDNAFYDCNISKITFPNSLLHIGSQAFIGNCYKEIVIPNSVKTVGHSAFNQSYLKTVTLSNSMEVIETELFGYCHDLTKVNIPNSITHIKNKAFVNCSSLKDIDIPKSVILIDDNAFEGCESLSQNSKDAILKINPNANFKEVCE